MAENRKRTNVGEEERVCKKIRSDLSSADKSQFQSKEMPVLSSPGIHPALIYLNQEPLSTLFSDNHPPDYNLISQFIKDEELEAENSFTQPNESILIIQSISQESMTPTPTTAPKPVEVALVFPDEQHVKVGFEEFNPLYIKCEPHSPSFSDLSSPSSPQHREESTLEQTGAGGFTVTDKQSAHASYFSNITLTPIKRTGDLLQTLADLEKPLTELITNLLAEHRGIKVFIVMDVEYESIIDASKPISDHLHTHFMPIFSEAEIPQFLSAVIQELILKNENFVKFKSGLRLKNIPRINISAAEHQPIAGRGFQVLPPFLANKRCIINVKNNDNRCFGYALLSSLEPNENHHQNIPSSYNQHFAKHHLDIIAYPVKLADIPAIEATLPFAINVFSFDDDTGHSRCPKYNSPKTGVPVIDLLYWNEHYALITNFNRFLGDIKKFHGRQHFCRRCFGHFWNEKVLVNHQSFCLGFNGCKTNIRMPPENSYCEFKSIKNQLKCPFVIYADFECLLPENQNQSPAHLSKTVTIQKHIPYSVGFKLVGPDLRTLSNQDVTLDYSNKPYEFHTGQNSAEWLLQRLMELESAILKVLFNEQRMGMTAEDTAAFTAATKCHICDKGWDRDEVAVHRAPESAKSLDSYDNEEPGIDEEIEEYEQEEECAQQPKQPRKIKWEKVRDHDHLTGKYRGAAHNFCNWQYRKQFQIPVFFHNLKNYDGHLIVRAMEKFPNYLIKPIAQGLEKYLIIGWGKHLVFKDTLQFMAASLEQLAKNLLNKGREHFVHLHHGFNETAARMDLILRKGVFPYDFMRTWQSIDFRMLPSRQNFFNNLKQEKCSVADYQHAHTVWNEFSCKTMKDYCELYMKTGKLFFPFFLFL